MEGKLTEGFNRDNFLHQVSVQKDPSRGCEVVGRGILENIDFGIAVRINFPGKKVGVLEGFVLQGTPEAGTKGKAKVGQSRLSMFLAGKEKVNRRVRDEEVLVRVFAFRVKRDKEAGGSLREKREKGGLAVQSDRAEGKLPHAREFVQDNLLANDNTGADPA